MGNSTSARVDNAFKLTALRADRDDLDPARSDACGNAPTSRLTSTVEDVGENYGSGTDVFLFFSVCVSRDDSSGPYRDTDFEGETPG